MPEHPSGSRPQAERWTKVLAVAGFSALYLPPTLLLAWLRPFWNDELFTYYISLGPGWANIWDALLRGGDQIPPLFYWITRASMSLPGNPQLTARIPEIVGFWLLGVCLAAFVWHRLPAVYGLLAAAVALVTGAYQYAYEARPYGIVVGMGALALLCRQRAGERHGRLWAAGLAASLAIAVSTHYYAVLLFLPLAGAEAVRFWMDRHLRWRVWGALALGATPLLAWLPLIRAARTYAGTFWAKPGITALFGFANFLLGPALLPLSALLVGIGVYHLMRRAPAARGPTALAVPPDEMAAVLLFLSLPVGALALGMLVTGAFTERYALPAVIGAGVFAVWLAATVFQCRTRPALLALGLVALFFLARGVHSARVASSLAATEARMIAFLRDRTDAALPILIADPHLFFVLSHEAPPALRERLRYFADARLALRHLGTDSIDRYLVSMGRWAPLRLEKLDEFMRSGRSILIYGYPATWEWVVQELVEVRVPVAVIGVYEGRLLLIAGPAAPGRLPTGPASEAPSSGTRARR